MAPRDEESFEVPAGSSRDARVDYRRGCLADADGLARMARRAYGGDIADWRTRLARAFERDDLYLVLAEHRGVIVGYGKANACEPASEQDAAPRGYYLTGLIVDLDWRRRGIGTELTRPRLDWIWSHGQPAWFFTNARNHASLDLHTGLGFVETGRAASYLGEPFNGGVGVLLRADPPGIAR